MLLIVLEFYDGIKIQSIDGWIGTLC